MKEVINWNQIRSHYVMGNDMPSFDFLVNHYKIAKQTLISMANDREHDLNGGYTWVEQRNQYMMRKRNAEETAMMNETKKVVTVFRDGLSKLGINMFSLINKYFEQEIKKMQTATDNGEDYHLPSTIKISDFIKLSQAIKQLSETGHNSKPFSLVVTDANGKKSKLNLMDLSDDVLDKLDRAMDGEEILDAEFTVED